MYIYIYINIFIYIYIYISQKQTSSSLNENIENIHHFVVSTITYNSTGWEHIVQDGKFISVIFICYFSFSVFLCIFIVINQKK